MRLQFFASEREREREREIAKTGIRAEV